MSCTMAIETAGTPAKVIFPTGMSKEFDYPVEAAELMFESPNNFVASTANMKVGRRFSALSADDELEMGCVYILMNMKRLNTLVTADDMAFVHMPSSKRIAAVQSVLVEEKKRTTARLEEVVAAEGFDINEMKFRMGSKSRKPMLETIQEDNSAPICSH